MSHLIYLSYDKDDIAAVENVCCYFRQVNFSYWFDRESMNPDDDHEDVLEFILRAGGNLLSFFSRANCENADSVVQKDFRYAQEVREKFDLGHYGFLPVKIGECMLPDIKIKRAFTVSDLQMHPEISLRDIDVIDVGQNSDIGSEVMKHFGKSGVVIDFSMRENMMACMMDFNNILSGIYGWNIIGIDKIDTDASKVKMFLENQHENILKLIEWGDDFKSMLKVNAPVKG
jgi:hypothetical protein